MHGSAAAGSLPPGLAGHWGGGSSIASTSSSLPSSFQPDDGGFLNGMNDLEEIGLDDDDGDGDAGSSERGRPHAGAPQRGSLPSTLRDLTTHVQLKRPSYPPAAAIGLSSHQPPSVDHLAAPAAASGRSKKLHAAPALPRGPAPPPRSRHASPVRRPIVPLGHSHPNGLSNGYRPKVSPGAPKRTPLQRKTSEQLEDEYDSDDEVPPDAIFYNVPLSPSDDSARSTAASTTGSAAHSTRSLPATGSAARASAAASAATTAAAANTATTTATAVSAAPAAAAAEESANGLGLRSKSWSDAMFELGAEAKELSEALERHADETLVQTEKRLQSKSEAPAPVRRKSSTPSIHAVELPPLQVSNGMIDPLPISKEKKAVLSRTRPSWLPPKSREEEKRHLKEYQKMMRRSQEAERKRVQKERQDQEEKERLQNEFSNEWETKIMPNWNRACRSSATREMWWKGVAPRCRGQVWSRSFGNHLAVSAETFRLALKRAKEIEAGLEKTPTMYTARERELFVAIRRDVKTTFPELKIFQEGGPLYESLLDVLMAYSMYRSDVGYVYGTHTVAGMLLLNQSAEQAFITLANMLNRPLPLAFFTQDDGAISRSYSLFLKAFQYKLPSLHRHIHQNLRIDPALYLEPMFLTLFSLQCPVDTTSRIWDIYSFEGDSFLVRTAVGIMAVLESKLYGDRHEVLRVLGWNAGVLPLGKDDDFIAAVRNAGREEIPTASMDQF